MPNGSFEAGFFRGFTTTGATRVSPSHRRHEPTHGAFLATLETTGIATAPSTLTSDRFYVPEGLGFLLFDFNLLASLLTAPAHELLAVRVLADDAESVEVPAVPAPLEMFLEGDFSAYEQGSGWQSAAVDLQAYAGALAPIRIQFVLRALPRPQNLRADHRPDDANLLGYPSQMGTGWLLDNLRLSGGGALPLPLMKDSFSVAYPAAGEAEFHGSAAAVAAGSRVWARALASGQLYETVAGGDGTFALPVTLAADGRSFFVLSYATPKTTTNATSNRLFSPGLSLEVAP